MDTDTTWIVLRCASSKTLPLMRRLNDDERWEPIGAWSPMWKRRRRLPRSSATRLMELPAIPSFVFVPAERIEDLPVLPALPYTLMRIEGVLVIVPDRHLEPLRRIDTQPKDPIKVLPKIGAEVRFIGGPFEGMRAKVVYSGNRYTRVVVEGFTQPLQVPPSILQETVLQDEQSPHQAAETSRAAG